MSYQPINCTFHDLLLDKATRNERFKIVYSEEGQNKVYQGLLLYIFSKSGKEFLIGEGDFKLRLDQIVVHERYSIILTLFCYFFSCIFF